MTDFAPGGTETYLFVSSELPRANDQHHCDAVQWIENVYAPEHDGSTYGGLLTLRTNGWATA